MTKADRKDSIELRRLVNEYMQAVGAVTGTARMGLSGLLGGVHDWNLETQAGLLGVSHDRDATYLHSIYARFQDVDRAVKTLNRLARSHLNPYSGKWNFNWSLGDYAEAGGPRYMFEQFRTEVDSILLPETREAYAAQRAGKEG